MNDLELNGAWAYALEESDPDYMNFGRLECAVGDTICRAGDANIGLYFRKLEASADPNDELTRVEIVEDFADETIADIESLLANGGAQEIWESLKNRNPWFDPFDEYRDNREEVEEAFGNIYGDYETLEDLIRASVDEFYENKIGGMISEWHTNLILSLKNDMREFLGL